MLAPEAVITAYRERGYDFLALTDHFLEPFGFPITDTQVYRSADFTTLLGAELHASQTESGNLWHLLAVGLPLDFVPTSYTETGPELAARASAAGAFVGIAHPAWYTLTLADALSLTGVDAVEVYNENCQVANDRGDSWYLLEMLLAKGKRLLAYAADDAHFVDGEPDAFGGWVQVKAERLTPEALLAALKVGEFYSSQGPEIHDVVLAGEAVSIACSPCQTILLTGSSFYASVKRGPNITQCTLPLPAQAGPYLRVTVIDVAGKRAWTNPLWLE
jgi:hypothetical protein